MLTNNYLWAELREPQIYTPKLAEMKILILKTSRQDAAEHCIMPVSWSKNRNVEELYPPFTLIIICKSQVWPCRYSPNTDHRRRVGG